MLINSDVGSREGEPAFYRFSLSGQSSLSRTQNQASFLARYTSPISPAPSGDRIS